jgi:hypothetical protein
MLNDRERSALEQWYSRDIVLADAKRLYDQKQDEDLEEYLHMICLFPLSHHTELPDYMRDDDGKTLFPTNLNPQKDLEKWQDAIEVGWTVMQQKLGFSHKDVHERIAELQEKDWAEFMARAEARKKRLEAEAKAKGKG